MSHLITLLVAHAAATPTVTPDVVPADGRQEAIVLVETFGRYALETESLQGVSLQLIDRMTGPGQTTGGAGRDGRLDLFLERGEYKLVTHGGGRGEVGLTATAFEELDGRSRLEALVPLTATLGDRQQRSWWLDLRSGSQAVDLELAGRALADVRIWRDGTWLVDAEPRCSVAEPVTGQPLNRCVLHHSLPEGLYLVSAYGGAPLDWAQDSALNGTGGDRDALHLRYGVPLLAEAGRQHHTLSPFGVDRYRVPADSRYARVELPQPDPVTLSIGPWTQGLYSVADGAASIERESRVPYAEVTGRSHSGEGVLTVSGAAGQPYVLQHLAPFSSGAGLSGDGEFWLSTLHSGYAGDSVDATAVLVRGGDYAAEVQEDRAVVMDGGVTWRGRFNLQSKATLLVTIEDAGDYRFTADAEVRVRMRPFLLGDTIGVDVPELVTTREATWDLNRGTWLLEIHPHEQEVITADLSPDSLLSSLLGAAGVEAEVLPSQPAAALGVVRLNQGMSQRLFLGEQPGVTVGLVQRRLPVDLHRGALPLVLGPGEQVTVPARWRDDGWLRAVDEQGRELEVSTGGDWARSPAVDAREAEVSVRNPHDVATTVALWQETWTPDSPPPLPSLDAQILAGLPEFPTLTAEAPAPLELGRQDAKTWRVDVTEAGLYTLGSRGLLHTEGAVRTRVRTSLASDTAGGPGRNFQLQEYLGQGDYQLTVNTVGQTRGHLSIALAPSPMLDGGALREGVTARASLAANQGAVYTFTVPEEGRYRLRAVGQTRVARCRLEDGDGWPVLQPGLPAELDQTLRAGDYRLVILPTDVPGRLLTSLERQADTIATEGHGPHPYTLGAPASHTWIEDPDRPADAWTFSLPAPASVSASVSGEMHGELLDADGAVVARLVLGEPATWQLPAGDYRLALKNARRNNRVPYTLELDVLQLLVGMTRRVNLPRDLVLSVGEAGLVELTSAGRVDVRARLYGDSAGLLSDGPLIASNDDRPMDWNFRLLEALEPGRYVLRLDSVTGGSGQVEVRMRAPDFAPTEALAAGREVSISAGSLVPLEQPRSGDVMMVGIDSAETWSAALERQVGGQWRAVDSGDGRAITLAARAAEGPWRVRLTSLEDRGNAAALRYGAAAPRRVSEAAVSGGIRAERLRGWGDRPAPLVFDATPGVYLPLSAPEGLRRCPAPGEGCRAVDPGGLPTDGDTLWLLSPPGERLALRRATADGLTLTVRGEAEVGLSPGAGPALVVAAAVVGQPAVFADGPSAFAPGASAAVAEVAQRVRLTGDGLEVRLQETRFPEPGVQHLHTGRHDEVIQPGQAARYTVPAGSRLRAGLAAGLALRTADRLYLAWDEALSVDEPAPGVTLLVMNRGDTPASVSLDLTPGSSAPYVSFAMPFEREALRAGLTPVMVHPEPGATLRLTGASAATLVGPSGVQRGLSLDPGAGGTLYIEHAPGFLMAWVERPDDPTGGLLGAAMSGPAEGVSLPADLALSGAARRYEVIAPTGGLLRLSSEAPLIAAVDGRDEVVVLSRGGEASLWLPPGPNILITRAPAGRALTGTLSLRFDAPRPAVEGLGEPALMAPGDTLAYAFQVTRAGHVGVGVRADSDRVVVGLLDAHGAPVVPAGQLTHMPRLTPGAYTLTLHLPADAAPVTARPALAGVALPEVGPPAPVIRSYR